MTTQEIFEQHLNNVCKNALLRKVTMEFYHDFCSYFKGQVFTRDNFETLTVKGNILEQDVVIDLFKDRESVLPEEVLTYLFTHGIKQITTYKETTNRLGYVSPLSQKMSIYYPSVKSELKKKNLEYLNNYYTLPENLSDSERKKYIKKMERVRKKELKKRKMEIRDQVEVEIYKSIKSTVYHEMGHVFQFRVFGGGKYIKSELTKETLIKSTISASCYEDEITSKSFRDSSDNKYAVETIQQSSPVRSLFMGDKEVREYIRDMIINEGYAEISEYINEEFSRIIEGNLVLGSPKFNDGYVRKTHVTNRCAYNVNYDIAQLIKLAISDIDEKDLRFNGAKYFERLNNLKISEETLARGKEALKSEILSQVEDAPKGEKDILGLLLKEVDGLDSVGLIGVGMRMSSSENENCKLIIQDLLIEAIRNNILDELEDENCPKDEKFFQKLNSTLEMIDSVILYPAEYSEYYHSNEYLAVTRESILNINILSVDEFARRYDNLHHIVGFSKICEVVSNAKTLYEDKIAGIDDKMTFFKKQIELDRNRHGKLELQKNALEQKMKTELEREQRMEERRLVNKERRQRRQEIAAQYGVDPKDVVIDGGADIF